MKKYFFYLIVLGFVACSNNPKKIILISKDYNSNVKNWLLKMDSTLLTKEFYSIAKDSMNFYLQQASGIVLGGGEDVNPTLYNKPEYKAICEVPDNFRDSIEFLLINYAVKNKIPLLGICRGNQILNVANGGTLIPDIPSFKKNCKENHRSSKDSAHVIIPTSDSWIGKSFGNTIWVNSKHHQSIAQVADIFKVAAISGDSIIESIQVKDTVLHPFLIGVQWHPELLHDSLSVVLGKMFLRKL